MKRELLSCFLLAVVSIGCAQKVNSRIVLVNIEDLDVLETSAIIESLAKFSPKVVAVDVALTGNFDDETRTVIRRRLSSVEKLVLPTILNDIGLPTYLVTSSFDLRLVPDFMFRGFVSAEVDSFEVAPTSVRLMVRTAYGLPDEYHFAITTAMLFDSLKATNFLSCHPEFYEVNFKKRESFKRLDASAILEGRVSKDLIGNKIVLVGYLGPGMVDKYYTRFKRRGTKDGPDMYGVELLANIVHQILEYDECQ